MTEDKLQTEEKGLDFQTLLNRAQTAEVNRKFTISTNHYFTLLTRCLNLLSENTELLQSVINSFVINIVLLPVGLQRERMLNFVLKHEHLNVFSYKPLLEKIYSLITETEFMKFVEDCPTKLTHEKQVFEKAIFEHNLISLSRVYENISFSSLQKHLNLDLDKILNYTFKMILEKKLSATIDEVDQLVYFIQEQTNSLSFDKQIHNFCLQVNQLSEYIKNKNKMK